MCAVPNPGLIVAHAACPLKMCRTTSSAEHTLCNHSGQPLMRNKLSATLKPSVKMLLGLGCAMPWSSSCKECLSTGRLPLTYVAGALSGKGTPSSSSFENAAEKSCAHGRPIMPYQNALRGFTATCGASSTEKARPQQVSEQG